MAFFVCIMACRGRDTDDDTMSDVSDYPTPSKTEDMPPARSFPEHTTAESSNPTKAKNMSLGDGNTNNVNAEIGNLKKGGLGEKSE